MYRLETHPAKSPKATWETSTVTWGSCQRYFFWNSANVMSANWFKRTENEEEEEVKNANQETFGLQSCTLSRQSAHAVRRLCYFVEAESLLWKVWLPALCLSILCLFSAKT